MREIKSFRVKFSDNEGQIYSEIFSAFSIEYIYENFKAAFPGCKLIDAFEIQNGNERTNNYQKKIHG